VPAEAHSSTASTFNPSMAVCGGDREERGVGGSQPRSQVTDEKFGVARGVQELTLTSLWTNGARVRFTERCC